MFGVQAFFNKSVFIVVLVSLSLNNWKIVDIKRNFHVIISSYNFAVYIVP